MASPIIYPKWEKHSIGNIYQLDEEVSIDVFREETNFNGLVYYDPTTRLVKYYSSYEHYRELNDYEATTTLQGAILSYVDNDSFYVLSDFVHSRSGWDITLSLGLNKRKQEVTLRVDSGATFSILTLEKLSFILDIDPQKLSNLLRIQSRSAKVRTALGTIPYYAVNLQTTICNKDVILRVYVDITNTLPVQLLGFDVIQSLHFIANPGVAPMLLDISVDAYKQFCDNNPEKECNVIDLLTVFKER